ncbi:MAG: ester cyclase [Syntrophobacteraceae bacterium]
MNAEQIKAWITEATEEVINKQNVDLVDTYYTADFVNHNPNRPDACNLEGYKQWLQMLNAAFPTSVTTLDDIIVEGDKVVVRWTAIRTGKGVFFGIDITGKKATNTGMTIMRMVDNKVAEAWWNVDMLGLLQQLGLIPLPGQAAKA